MPLYLEVEKQILTTIHTDLASVLFRAREITDIDFALKEGVRSPLRQSKLLALGVAVENSRHLSGYAVDIVPWVDHSERYETILFNKLAAAIKEAAIELSIDIVWGGDWDNPDLHHFELDINSYPAV